MTALAGKTALVTGGSRGIGRGICERLAGEGALVAVHYASNDTAAKETVTAIEAAGGHAFTLRAELGVNGDADAVIRALEAELRQRTGQTRLDILVNNAGINDSGGGIDTETSQAFDRLFAVNVRAPFFLIQRALPLMGEGGRIINIGSAATRIALPGELAYAMTKAAMETLTRNVANQIGSRGITINTVAPGPTRTDKTALILDRPEAQAMVAASQAIERVGTPADIANVVAFLASDQAPGSPPTSSTPPAAPTSDPNTWAEASSVTCSMRFSLESLTFGSTVVYLRRRAVRQLVVQPQAGKSECPRHAGFPTIRAWICAS